MEATDLDVATQLTYIYEQTSSPNMLETDLKAIKSIRHHANKPLSEIPIQNSVLKGLLKNTEPTELFCPGLEPEMVKTCCTLCNNILDHNLF